MAGTEEELQELTSKLETVSRKYRMEINKEKIKILVNRSNNHKHTNIWLNGQKLEEVETFKYHGSYICNDGNSGKEIKSQYL
uniref:Reverse transcriptase domain-containing protein n=2 Tax=Arion vulgaris TaxID=1028688 RepID=A0A0B7AVG4_9EUPU